MDYENLKYPGEPARFTGSDIEKFAVWCVEQNTSDITIKSEEQIFCEIHGRKVRVTNRRLSRSELIEIISAIYQGDGAIAKLNSGEDVDIPWNIKIDRKQNMRFRINMTTILAEGHKGYEITIRTIKDRAPLLETLNLPQPIIDNMTHKQGLIIIVGATGSGKSTLLASVLDWRMRQPDAHLKILCYESPIEYVYDDVPKPTAIVSQTQIGLHLPNFAAGVRNALRRKPDIILLGEMRDQETIGEGITASMTGHLVYGTLHANGVSDSPKRMVNVFPTEEKNARAIDILSSIKLIVAQMLLPSIDGKRVAIREYLVFTQEIADYLQERPIEKLTYEIRKMLEKHGQTFLQDAQNKLDEGVISEKTFNEVKKITKGAELDMNKTVDKSNDVDENAEKTSWNNL